MKKLLTILALNLVFIAVNAQTTLFFEGFENELTGWTLYDNDGDGKMWESLNFSMADMTGNACYASYSFDMTTFATLTPDNWLITPAIDLPNTSFTLTWIDAPISSEMYEEHLEVLVSTTGTDISDFTTIFETTINSENVNQRSIDLSDFADEMIYIAFVHNECSDQLGLMIDNISIIDPDVPDYPVTPIDTTDPIDPIDPVDPVDPIDPIDPVDPVDPETGIADAVMNSVNIFPNPAHEVLHVRADGFQTIEIVNFLGQFVYSSVVTNNEMQINVADLTAGTYFIRLRGENEMVTQKVMLY